jgi:squalene cyclase
MAIKTKELKDDAIVSIQVNKNFYLMTKAVAFYLYNQMPKEGTEEYIKACITKQYQDLDDLQRSFHTLTILLAEIEKQAKDADLYLEKEILEPTDEGYVAPKPD